MWQEHAERTKVLFEEAEVTLTEWEGHIQTEIYGWNRNEKIQL